MDEIDYLRVLEKPEVVPEDDKSYADDPITGETNAPDMVNEEPQTEPPEYLNLVSANPLKKRSKTPAPELDLIQ